MNVAVRLDTTAWEARLQHCQKEGLQAMRAGVNRALVVSKKTFAVSTSSDAAGKSATAAAVKRQIYQTTRAGTQTLTASFSVKNPGFKHTPLVLRMLRGNQYKPGSGTIATFKNSGGGSASLTSSKFYLIKSNGGSVVLSWRKGGRKPKRIYSEAPATALGQASAAPRKAWEASAKATMQTEISARLAAVMAGGSAGSTDGGSD